MTYKVITVEVARDLLDYDPKTGFLTWKHRANGPKKWNTRYAGKRAGSTNKSGYVNVQMGRGNQVGASIIAWMICKGVVPTAEIDHEDGDRSNNRESNLREAPDGANSINKAIQRNNTSGFVGVSFSTQAGKWHARVTRHKKTYHAGFFDTPEDAANARDILAAKIHGQFFVSDPVNRKRFPHVRDDKPKAHLGNSVLE